MKLQLIFAGVCFVMGATPKISTLKVDRLRCEYIANPLGIDSYMPRLSWQLTSDDREQLQTAYQIMVSSDSASLLHDRASAWNSQKINSSRSTFVYYKGRELRSGTKYFWKVRVWDMNGNPSEWSKIASWSMGIPDKAGWKAKWIGITPENVPLKDRYYIHRGYHSGIERSSDRSKSVVIDLGKTEAIQSLRLFPSPSKAANEPYLFPLRFSVEAAASGTFLAPVVLANESKADYKLSGMQPYEKRFNKTNTRFIRVTVNKLPALNDSSYAFALAEIEILNADDINVALGKKVIPDSSSSYNTYLQFSNENWFPERLTDGHTMPNPNHKPYSLPVPPSPMLRKSFTVSRPIKNSFLYVTALGLYEMSVNGKKAGDQVLAPEWTDYHSRVQYQTYDVKDLLQEGENVLGAILADGWYAGAVFSHPERGSYGFDRKLLAQLEIEYTDGTRQTIGTDNTWKVFNEGPVKSASIFDGEKYDANAEPAGWGRPGFQDTSWNAATIYDDVNVEVDAQLNEPIKVIQNINPVSIIPQKNGTYIFDFGQNIAGWIHLRLPYNPSKQLILRHAEVLDEKGELYTANLRGAKQTDTFIPGQQDVIDYEPRFTYHGFRYVEISGLTKAPEIGNVIGKVVASSAPLAGSFECSSNDLNKLWKNILWTQRGNMHSIPTDCPQRDERAGWMGDAQVFSNNAILNMDMGAFFTKWVKDIRNSQTREGFFPDYAPQVGSWANFYNSPGWGDAGVIVPWRLYEYYGDTTVLSDQYDAMKKFIASILRYNKNLLWRKARGNMYGDWLNGNTIVAADYPKEGGKVPDDVYSTAFFAYSTRIVSLVAKLLNKNAEAAYHKTLANDIKNAFIQAYVKKDGTIEGNTQAGYALALDFDLVPGNLREKAAAHMVEAIKAYDYRISTGIQTTVRLMNQLTEFGYNDIAYRLLESHRFPSWLYSIDQGATTIWERWDGYVEGRGFQDIGMNSFNHYAIGAVGEWMYRSILGINNDPKSPGYKHFYVRPVPGGSLTWAKGSYNSIAGKIEVSWKQNGNGFLLEVVIPANTTATVVIPSGKRITENGTDVQKSKGIKVVSTGKNETHLLVKPGKYNFSAS